MKKFLLFGLIAAVLPAVAEEAADRKTATSLKYVTHELDTRQDKFTAEANKAMEYTNSAGTVQKRAVTSELGTSTTDTSLPMVGGVNTKLDTKQDDIDPVNDHTAVTYTGQPGGIGQKGIYQATGTYAEQSDNLIDAKTFNAALKNGLDSEFVCSENRDPVSGLCWLYTIHNTVDNGLPDGYTELEYIGFTTGTETRIDTGIRLTNNHIIKVKVNGTDFRGIMGRWGGNDSYSSFQLFDGYYRFGSFRSGIGLSQYWNQTVVLQYGQNGLFVNGNFILRPDDVTFSAEKTCLIGSIGSTDSTFRGNIYEAWIYNGNSLVGHYIPARHDNKLGMYDTVSRQFFENAGDGTFGAGPVVDATVYIPQNQ